MEHYSPAAVERAMKVQEVILQAMNGKMKWLEAAEVLGISPRTVRRWKWKMEHHGLGRLLDARCAVPSCRRVPGSEIEGILKLYRERYAGFNVRHFVEIARRRDRARPRSARPRTPRASDQASCTACRTAGPTHAHRSTIARPARISPRVAARRHVGVMVARRAR